MLQRTMAVPAYRWAAAAAAVLLTAAIVVAIIAGTTDGTSYGGHAAASDSYCARFDQGLSGGPRIPNNHYTNALYGFALTIPTGVSAYEDASEPGRSLVIPLAAQPRALVRVDAAYDSLYDISAAGVHTRDSVYVRLFDRLISDHAEPYSLAGVQGGSYRMQVVCMADPTRYVFESIIVVRNREIYRLVLQTELSRQSQDESVLDRMAGSWAWLPLRAP